MKTDHRTCRLCRSKDLHLMLDFGPQPIANRFLMSENKTEESHPLELGLCTHCGLVQLIDPAPASALRAPFDWISYNEPEAHLDALADLLSSAEDNQNRKVVGALSYKDDSLLERLNKKGCSQSWRIEPKCDLGITAKNAGMESIQERLSSVEATSRLACLPKADILLARHILEHCQDLAAFLLTLKSLVKPDGVIVIEVPCCDRQMEQLDYTMLWEEHTFYFAPRTFKRCLELAGLACIHFLRLHYPLEDVLIAVVQIISEDNEDNQETGAWIEWEVSRARRFAAEFSGYRKAIDHYLSEFRNTKGGKRIAMFGAGHMAASYVNLLGLTNHIDCFLDDNPNKIGLFMPGSRRPIFASDRLVRNDIPLCLLALNPAVEEKIINKFITIGNYSGMFYSIFPGSRHALPPIKN